MEEDDVDFEELEFPDVEVGEAPLCDLEDPENYATWDSDNPFDLGMLD